MGMLFFWGATNETLFIGIGIADDLAIGCEALLV